MLFAGDALGEGKPASGAGISKALESGLTAGECAVAALTNGGPDDFTNYAQRMDAAWGSEVEAAPHTLIPIAPMRVLIDRLRTQALDPAPPRALPRGPHPHRAPAPATAR